jgi:hypothetical protein
VETQSEHNCRPSWKIQTAKICEFSFFLKALLLICPKFQIFPHFAFEFPAQAQNPTQKPPQARGESCGAKPAKIMTTFLNCCLMIEKEVEVWHANIAS